MPWLFTAICFLAVTCAWSAQAQGNLDPRRLIGAERAANSLCGGGSGNSNSTWEACGRRDALEQVLGEIGWCYGREGEAGYQMEWHRCGPGSRRQVLPR